MWNELRLTSGVWNELKLTSKSVKRALTDLSPDPTILNLAHCPKLVQILGQLLLHVFYVRRQLNLNTINTQINNFKINN